MGVEKFSPSLGWRHCRRRHLGIKMAAAQVTSGGRRDSREDVPSSERGGPSPKTSRRRLKLFLLFEKHLNVSLPHPFSKWLRELPAYHYGEVDQSARVNTTFHETWCWLRQAPTLLFFLFIFTVLYNIRKLLYSVIVGRSLVWLETNLNHTMTILLFFSILSTKRQWQVWAVRVRGQFDSVKKVWCLGYRVQIMRRRYLTTNIKMVNWPYCGGQRVSRLWQPESATSSTIDSSTVGLSCHPTQLR